MNEILRNLSLPIDNDKFFRRACPFCRREFKVQLDERELTDLFQKEVNTFLIDRKEETTDIEEKKSSETYFACPYCGEQAPSDSWWTQEQLAYIGIVVKNILAKIVNEQLSRTFKRNSQRPSSGTISIQFEGREMKLREPWISPEVNGMEIFELPCCQRKIKIEECWTGAVNCFFCGFQHERRNAGTNSI